MIIKSGIRLTSAVENLRFIAASALVYRSMANVNVKEMPCLSTDRRKNHPTSLIPCPSSLNTSPCRNIPRSLGPNRTVRKSGIHLTSRKASQSIRQCQRILHRLIQCLRSHTSICPCQSRHKSLTISPKPPPSITISQKNLPSLAPSPSTSPSPAGTPRRSQMSTQNHGPIFPVPTCQSLIGSLMIGSPDMTRSLASRQ